MGQVCFGSGYGAVWEFFGFFSGLFWVKVGSAMGCATGRVVTPLERDARVPLCDGFFDACGARVKGWLLKVKF
jgi:hypothetical protein